MGQYYHVFNVDKREQLLPFDYDNGLKLMEWSYCENAMVLALMNLLDGAWKGDRVYVIGDYADLDDPSEVWAPSYAMLAKEFNRGDIHYALDDLCLRVQPDESLKRYAYYKEELWSPHAGTTASVEDAGLRYIYNHATRQVIDLRDCPVEWYWQDKKTKERNATHVSPLPLLLAMGNGRGGGDYRGQNAELLGSWCSTVRFIEVSDVPLPGAEDYEEFCPHFTENESEPVKPTTKGA